MKGFYWWFKAIFCRTDNQVRHRELALKIFSSYTTVTNQTIYPNLLNHIQRYINPNRAFSNANRCLLEALVTITIYLPKHFVRFLFVYIINYFFKDFLFDLLHDLNKYDQLCLFIIETIFKRSDLSRYLFIIFNQINLYLLIVHTIVLYPWKWKRWLTYLIKHLMVLILF